MHNKSESNDNMVEIFINAVLQKYLNDFDINDEISLYNMIFEHFDELVNSYLFSVLNDLSEQRRQDVLNLALEYVGLCFKDGKRGNWLESTISPVNNDYEFISNRIIDNFQYLLGLSKVGGKNLLEEISSWKDNTVFKESSVVEYLRTTLDNDELLTKILQKFASKNELYNLFTDEQKVSLLSYSGSIYFIENEKTIIKDALSLAVEICEELNYKINKGDIEKMSLEITQILHDIDVADFNEALLEIVAKEK